MLGLTQSVFWILIRMMTSSVYMKVRNISLCLQNEIYLLYKIKPMSYWNDRQHDMGHNILPSFANLNSIDIMSWCVGGIYPNMFCINWIVRTLGPLNQITYDHLDFQNRWFLDGFIKFWTWPPWPFYITK